MNIASSYEKPPEYTQKKMDIKPVVNEILALKLMPVSVGIVKGREERITGQDSGSRSRNLQLVELIANKQSALQKYASDQKATEQIDGW